MAEPRYDGVADWYESYLAHDAYRAVEFTLLDLLGTGQGDVLDIGCGIGHHLPLIEQQGWHATGLDYSTDMLRRAQTRTPRLTRGDAARLPFPDGAFDAVTSSLMLTDVPDVAPVFAEMARVARHRVVIVAVHPCFAGPTARLDPESWTVTVSPGYLDTHVRHVGEGVRARVGVRHVPLHELLTKLAGAGLRTERVVETGPGPMPLWLGISATRAPC